MTATPEALRDQGMNRAEIHADARVLAVIDAEIARLNATGRPWSTNDARQALPTCSPGLVGARVTAARMRGEMVPVVVECASCGNKRAEKEPSTLDSTHGKEIGIYVGVKA